MAHVQKRQKTSFETWRARQVTETESAMSLSNYHQESSGRKQDAPADGGENRHMSTDEEEVETDILSNGQSECLPPNAQQQRPKFRNPFSSPLSAPSNSPWSTLGQANTSANHSVRANIASPSSTVARQAEIHDLPFVAASRAQFLHQLLTAPRPQSSPLEKRDFDHRMHSRPLTQTANGHSLSEGSRVLPSQLRLPPKSYRRERSEPRGSRNGLYSTKLVPEWQASRPDRRNYEELESGSSRTGILTRLHALQEMILDTITSVTKKHTELSSNLPANTSSDLLRKERQHQIGSLALHFDVDLERRRELEERAAAEGHSFMQPLGNPEREPGIFSIPRNPDLRRVLEKANLTNDVPWRAIPQHQSSENALTPASSDYTIDDEEESADSDESSDEETEEPKSPITATHEDTQDHAQNWGSDVVEASGAGPGNYEEIVNQGNELQSDVGESWARECGEDESANLRNRDRKGKAPQRRSMSFKGDLRVTKSQFLRYFPHRKPFRRMKTWAGKEYNVEDLNPDDARALPMYPCPRNRTKNADDLGMGQEHKSVSATAAQAPENRGQDLAEGLENLANPADKTTAKTTAKSAAKPLTQPTRRNPPRAAKKR